jgi:hypothetical protein
MAGRRVLPEAEVIGVVLDQLDTHKVASHYAAFAQSAERGASPERLDRRIGDQETLKQAVATHDQRRNADKATIDYASRLMMLGLSCIVFIRHIHRDGLLARLPWPFKRCWLSAG